MQITDKDWVQLSAYLDGELSGRDLNQLRKRMLSDPQLQSALEQLKITKQILRTAPHVPAPRNFTLTQKMVGFKPKKPTYPRYRLAAVVTSFLLIGVLVLDLGRFVNIGAMAPTAPIYYREVSQESIPEAAADAVEEPSLLVAEGEVDQDQMKAELEEQPADEPAASIAVEEAIGEPVSEGMAEDELDSRTLEKDITGAENLAEEKEETFLGYQVSSTQTLETEPTTSVFDLEEEVHPPERETGVSFLRILEIVLGVGVLGFSAAAWFRRKKPS